ncbi:phage baseplate assembly protein V [Thalassospira alkalitolerans]|uniref:phage baseplate assembly protein V n=1 Tax=Thalassospira alkalitolerans TaxID=1293890 RepID=UPI0030EF5A92
MDRMTLMFNRLIRPLKRRVFLMVSRAVIKIINDAEGIQKLQLVGYDGELHEGVERFQEYGFTSHPKSGAEAVVVAVAGNRGHSLVIALDDRKFRLKSLQPGEMAIYDDLGQKVHLKRDGIYVETPLKLEAIVGSSARLIAPAGVRLETPNLEVTGEIKDRCDTDGTTMAEMRDVYNSHVHPENDEGGPTDGPSEAM